MISILPADNYIVINKTIFTDYDKKIISMLYQPIIGINATNLYLTLYYELDKSELMSDISNHHHLMTSTKLSLDEIIIAREKLEGIGLLKTYYKEEKEEKSYVYELFSPLKPNELFSHPILNVVLYNNIGKKEYDKLFTYFKLPKVKLSEYKDITKSFNEVFDSVNGSYFENSVIDIKSENKSNIIIESNFDSNLLISSFPKETINKNAITKEIKDLIIKLSFIYNLNEEEMKDIIINSLNEKLMIDKSLLRKTARNYYQFENAGKLPTLVYKKSTIKTKKGNDKRSKMIYTFENVSPYNFLKSKYNGAKPTTRDLALIDNLIIDTKLSYPVVNVLIDYVMKINDKKLNKNFVETIAGQWKRLGIETAEEAMSQAEKDYKKSKNIKQTNKTKKETKLPEWFDKEIDKKEISSEEENELKNMLKEFK